MTTSVDVTDLTVGRRIFNIRSVGTDMSGTVVKSEDVSFTFRVLSSDLRPPRNLRHVETTLVGGSQGHRLSWQAPAEGDTPEGYPWTLSGPVSRSGDDNTGLSVEISGLPDGVYTFGVSSKLGDEEAGPLETQFKQGTPSGCQPPTGLTGSEGSPTTTWNFSWTAPTSGADSYKYRITGANQRTGTATGTSVSETSLGVGKSTIYVKSACGSVESEIEAIFGFTVEGGSRDGCLPPKNVQAEESSVSTSTWIGSWERLAEGDAPDDYSYRVTGATSIGTKKAGGLRVTLPSLNAGRHNLFVKSHCGTEESVEVKATFSVKDKDVPNPPKNLTALYSPPAHEDDNNDQEINFSWAAPDDGPTPTGYEVRMEGPVPLAAKVVDAFNVAVSRLTPGEYTFYVRSVKDGLKSDEGKHGSRGCRA